MQSQGLGSNYQNPNAANIDANNQNAGNQSQALGLNANKVVPKNPPMNERYQFPVMTTQNKRILNQVLENFMPQMEKPCDMYRKDGRFPSYT